MTPWICYPKAQIHTNDEWFGDVKDDNTKIQVLG
jgi:hypothetical protein